MSAEDAAFQSGKKPALSSPSLTPSHPLSSKEHARVMTNAESPEPHRGWHSRGYLPHWDHPGMIQSVNFRLADALPQAVLAKWRAELELFSMSKTPGSAGFQPARTAETQRAGRMPALPARSARETELRRRVEEHLDAGHGVCWLRRPELAALVENALRHFDGARYRLLAWCVMPNHVHALIETQEGFPLGEAVHSWKSFTGNQANKLLGRTGEFWQADYLDRYVRHAEHFAAVVAYIEENPVKAGLVRVKTEWPWSSARFHTAGSAGFQPASS